MNNVASFTATLYTQIFSDENVEVAKSIVARLYYAEAEREKRRLRPRIHKRESRLPSPLHDDHEDDDDDDGPSTSSPMSHGPSLDGLSLASSSAVSSVSSTRDQPLYDVFLGGSCGNTVWRRQLVIPFLKKRAITYYDPQRSVWSENMIYEESIAKENSSLFLFVLDPATVNATSFLEIAYFAARKAPKLLVVFLGRSEWREKAHPEDLPDRLRTCLLLDRILAAHHVPMLHSIEEALKFIEEDIIGGKKWSEALLHPRQRLAFLTLRTRRVFHSAGEGARAAWTRLRSTASKVTLAASAADMAVVVAIHLSMPHLPLVWIVVPLVALNILLFGSVAAYVRFRARCPRRLVDSSRSPSVPVPRMSSSITAPLLPQAPLSSARPSSLQKARALAAASSSSSVPLPFGEPLRRRLHSGRRRLEISDAAHDVYLSCSSDEELSWVGLEAAPFLCRHGLSFSSVLACDGLPSETRMSVLMRGSKHYKQLLYYIPSTKTFLSGMLEIAYLLGHANWQVTVCVPREAEQLEAEEEEDDEARAARRRRNDCYAIAFCYLKDMAKRKQSRVFSSLDEALSHVRRTARDC